MEDLKTEYPAASEMPIVERRPYRTPTLRRLGDIQSVVQGHGGNGPDGGGSSATS